jgi:hypothetical protein
VQAKSHQRTGYLPITKAAFELTEKSGFYKQNPGTDVAVTQMIRKTTDKSRGIRLGNFVQIRTINDEELEQVWAGKKTAKEALDAAVKRGNEQLERFQKANKGLTHKAACTGQTPCGKPPFAFEKRVLFKIRWLPWVLMAPQMAVILVFFFWPAGQALYQSVLQQDAFGTSRRVRRPGELPRLFADETYLASFKTTAVFSLLVASLGLSIALLLAVMADRVIKALRFYKTLLIWPYAVAPAVAGVLWLIMFAPPYRRRGICAAEDGLALEPPAQRQPCHGADRDGRRVEADLVQLPVLPGGPAVDTAFADRSSHD